MATLDSLQLVHEGIFDEKNVFEMFAWLRPEENVMTFSNAATTCSVKIRRRIRCCSGRWTTRVYPPDSTPTFSISRTPTSSRRGSSGRWGNRINLKNVTCDVYLMAGSTDHITPWKGAYRSTQLFGGNIQFVLTNQNHTQTIGARGDNKPGRYVTES